jgi:hypothetical protein
MFYLKTDFLFDLMFLTWFDFSEEGAAAVEMVVICSAHIWEMILGAQFMPHSSLL